METATYLTYGISFLAIAICWSKLTAKAVLTPSVLFLIFFFIHAFPDPLIRQSQGLEVPQYVWETAAKYNVYCFGACVTGYLIGSLFLPARKIVNANLVPGYTERSYLLLLVIGFTLMLFAMFLLVYVGAAGGSRVLFSGYGDKPLAFRLAKFVITYNIAITVFLVVAPILDNSLRIRGAYFWVLLIVGMVILSDILTQGRQASFTVILGILVAVIMRKSRLSMKQMLSAGALIFIVTLFASMRNLQSSVWEVSIFDFISESFEHIFYFTLTTLPGQEVFFLTIDNMDPRIYERFGGSTYWWNLVSAFRLDMLRPEDYLTPSSWFAENFLPWDSYGRDFSMIAESYINFGESGWVVFILIGMFIAALNRIAFTTTSMFWLIWVALMVVNLTLGLRNDSLPFFTRAIFILLPLVLFMKVYRLVAIKRVAVESY